MKNKKSKCGKWKEASNLEDRLERMRQIQKEAMPKLWERLEQAESIEATIKTLFKTD